MDKSLNDSNFKLMVFLPLLATIANCVWVYVKLSANDWSVSSEDAKFIDDTTKLLSFILYIFLFTRDLKLLRNKNAYCPAWGWFFIPPVYFYKRQKHNSLGLSFFWIYLLSTFILVPIVTSMGVNFIASEVIRHR